MTTATDLLVFVVCLVLVLGSVLAGIARGRRIRGERRPESNHLGTIQGGLLGLLGLLLGFAFAGSMSRFIERQDSLAREADVIQTAYGRTSLLPAAPGDRARAALREYIRLRVQLLHQDADDQSEAIGRNLQAAYDAAFAATLEGVQAQPQLATLAVTGIEGVATELSRRDALVRRHLPTEIVVVLVLCSCLTMMTVGFGVGIAEKRSVGAALALAVLVALTLFMTFDFDRPGRGLVRLDPAPLEALRGSVGPGAGSGGK